MTWDFIFNHLTEIITALGALVAIWRSESKGKSYEKAATIMAEEIEKVGNSNELKDKVAVRMRLSKAATQVAIKMVVAYAKPNTPNPKFWQKALQWAIGGYVQKFLALVLCALMIGACAHTRRAMTSIDMDGSSTTYKVGRDTLFSKIDESADDFSAGIDKDGNWYLKTGESIKGMDATSALELLKSIMGFMSAVAPMFQPAPVPAPTPTP